jgi:hypothetical protein
MVKADTVLVESRNYTRTGVAVAPTAYAKIRVSEECSMSRVLIAAVFAVVAVSAGLVWLALKGHRTPADDHVTGNVLARINAEYRDEL